jgi:hypothetical protein
MPIAGVDHRYPPGVDSPAGAAADPPARQRFVVVSQVSGSSNRVVQVAAAVVRVFGSILSWGLSAETPRSKVQIRERDSGRVVVEYDYDGDEIGGAAEHVRKLEAQLDRETIAEFCRSLGLDPPDDDGQPSTNG